VRFRRLAARKGKKRAIVAVAHTILISLYLMLKIKQTYRELGADFLDRRPADQVKRYLLKRLKRLGVVVTIQSMESIAVLTQQFLVSEKIEESRGIRVGSYCA
jgi:predicted PurR-regulated permease PerM